MSVFSGEVADLILESLTQALNKDATPLELHGAGATEHTHGQPRGDGGVVNTTMGTGAIRGRAASPFSSHTLIPASRDGLIPLTGMWYS